MKLICETELFEYIDQAQNIFSVNIINDIRVISVVF